MFYPLMTPSECILGETHRTYKCWKTADSDEGEPSALFFHVSSDKEASVLQGWSVTCGWGAGVGDSAVTCCHTSPINPHQVVSPQAEIAAGGEAEASGWWLYHSRKRPEGVWLLESRAYWFTAQVSSLDDILLKATQAGCKCWKPWAGFHFVCCY